VSDPAASLRVLVVGRGKVAHGLQHAARAQHELAECRLRTLAKVSDADLRWAELVLLAVPDSAIRSAAEALSERIPPHSP